MVYVSQINKPGKRDVDPKLLKCCSFVVDVDGGPTLRQGWVNVSFLLGNHPEAKYLELSK